MTGASMTRRELARTLVLAGAAAAVTSPRPVTAAAPPEWPEVVAAAKKEGKLAVNTFPGDGYGRALKVFSQAYPRSSSSTPACTPRTSPPGSSRSARRTSSRGT